MSMNQLEVKELPQLASLREAEDGMKYGIKQIWKQVTSQTTWIRRAQHQYNGGGYFDD